MFKKRKLGYLLIALALILIAIIVYLFLQPQDNFLKNLFSRPSKEVISEDDQEKAFEKMKQEMAEQQEYPYDPAFEASRQWEEDDFKQVARSFAERFASFSSHSDYNNIEDLESLMSNKMKIWSSKYVADLKAKQKDSSAYYGTVGKVLVEPKIINPEQSSKIEVLVTVQRQEITSESAENIYDQDIKISFINENSKWVVDEAYWQ